MAKKSRPPKEYGLVLAEKPALHLHASEATECHCKFFFAMHATPSMLTAGSRKTNDLKGD